MLYAKVSSWNRNYDLMILAEQMIALLCYLKCLFKRNVSNNFQTKVCSYCVEFSIMMPLNLRCLATFFFLYKVTIKEDWNYCLQAFCAVHSVIRHWTSIDAARKALRTNKREASNEKIASNADYEIQSEPVDLTSFLPTKLCRFKYSGEEWYDWLILKKWQWIISTKYSKFSVDLEIKQDRSSFYFLH